MVREFDPASSNFNGRFNNRQLGTRSVPFQSMAGLLDGMFGNFCACDSPVDSSVSTLSHVNELAFF